MKRRVIQSVVACSLLSLGQQASSQLLPALQTAVERQVEQVTNGAVERSLEQVQTQVVDRTVEQVQSATVERVVEQAGAAVEQVVVDRVVQQQVDTVQEQTQNLVQTVVETVQSQAVEQVQAAVESTVTGAVEGVVETTQSQALEQVQKVVETVQSQATEQVQSLVDNVQNQAVDQAQQVVDSVQSQSVSQAQNALESLQAQVADAAVAIERSQGAIEQVQTQVTQVSGQIAGGAQEPAPERAPGLDAQTDAGADAATADPGSVAAAVPNDTTGQTPQRQTINNADGSPAFVEITLAPGVRAVEFEWLMVVTPEQRARLDAEAAELLSYLTSTEAFALAGGELLTFTVPPDLDANDAILDLVPANLRGQIDRNHIYDESQHTSGLDYRASRLALPMPAVCMEPVAVGVIDSAVDTAHPALAARAGAIHARSFVDDALAQPAGHGTAIAGLLVGDDTRAAMLRPLLPAATLYTAAVFHEQEGLQHGATLMRVLEALDWMVEKSDVRVINMSLAGPPNRLLEQAVTAATAKGKVIVAAAGNEGPYGPARYPAAYEAAIGVTAVDRDSTVFRFANQGKHIDYAALGVEVPTALQDGSIGPGSGTSLAAPVIAAFFACALVHHGEQEGAQAALDRRVLDLGLPGADPVYGRGLLHP